MWQYFKASKKHSICIFALTDYEEFISRAADEGFFLVQRQSPKS